MPQFATFASADAKCGQIDAHLLTIESQQENDFVSEWLTAESSKNLFTGVPRVCKKLSFNSLKKTVQ